MRLGRNYDYGEVASQGPVVGAARLAAMSVEIRDVADGVWLWRQPHPAWREGYDWDAEVTSVAVQLRGVSLVLDPLAPPPAAREV